MKARERLMATLRGQAVDRPPVSLYEIGGFKVDPADPDPFNIYNSPDWQPLLQLAEERTDLIRLRSAVREQSHTSWGDMQGGIRDEFFQTGTVLENGNRVTRTTLTVAGRTMTSTTRREPALDTIWTTEHLLKDADDIRAYLELPDEVFAEQVDVAPLIAEDEALGDRGIIMVDTEDPLCAAATLLDMQEYTILAMTEPELFHQLLGKCATYIHARTEQVSRQFPGHLWRIFGPEYASEPYLPPRLFEEYVVRYVSPMVKMIQAHGGYVRLHCHGRLRNILHHIHGMGVDALDPIEPPPHGDMELIEVQRQVGTDTVLFGNLEVCDIENLPPAQFEQVVARALREGTSGEGRGFVLLPTAALYGRQITQQSMQNYETIVRLATGYV
ncbi:MAG: uroporphyrinogen decarboxylase family protein [Candidatus Latescibacteria bacterium]|nr:uroporphyrinogen decarboxylase family protein [Candidatus Latescibacterota bacterium]MDP7634625.1 uroporphyrinogen decarboxylase family protein [Candidatus Latescibacterota bacterium]HJP33347.1 uroporphyrinogen decarboxylase family protein [Candidatus Latescibacterota bacterium]